MPTPTSQPPIDPPSDLTPFPSPQTFDILPAIHAVLSRLPNSSPSATLATNTAAHTQNTALGTIHTLSAQPATALSPALSTSLTDTTPLDPRNIPQAMAPVKIKIQKARGVVSALPDAQRSVAEQEREMGELEARIAGLRAVLGRLGERAADGGGKGNGEGEMDTRP